MSVEYAVKELYCQLSDQSNDLNVYLFRYDSYDYSSVSGSNYAMIGAYCEN